MTIGQALSVSGLYAVTSIYKLFAFDLISFSLMSPSFTVLYNLLPQMNLCLLYATQLLSMSLLLNVMQFEQVYDCNFEQFDCIISSKCISHIVAVAIFSSFISLLPTLRDISDIETNF